MEHLSLPSERNDLSANLPGTSSEVAIAFYSILAFAVDGSNQSPRVHSSAQVHDMHFRACVGLQAQYMYETFGKFPATIPSVYILMYLQSHHLDLDFYDMKFAPGAYLRTHKDHLKRWHGE
jgi:hypothetical protein